MCSVELIYLRMSRRKIMFRFITSIGWGGWRILYFSIVQVHFLLIEFHRGRVDDLSFFEYLSHFVFCQLNFIVLFPFLIKYYHILFIIIVFRLGCDRPSGLFLFVPAVLFSILTPLFCVSSSVSLSYLILVVPMRKCLGKHSCMSSPFPIAILNGTFLFREAK